MVEPVTMAALIGASAALGGGFLKSQEANVAAGQAGDHAANQAAIQLQMALHGVKMRARDIMQAYGETGLHPLALMGVQAPTYTPTNFVGSADTSMGDAVSAAGQSLSRGLMATATLDERDKVYTNAVKSINLRKGELELQLLASQIRRMNMVGPAMPSLANPNMIIGQGDAPGTNTTNIIRDSFAVNPVGPKERTALPEVGHLSSPGGGLIPVPAKEAKERIEDDFWAQTGFFVRNNLLPQFNTNSSEPYPAPAGYRWHYDMINGYRLERAPTWHGRGHPSERR